MDKSDVKKMFISSLKLRLKIKGDIVAKNIERSIYDVMCASIPNIEPIIPKISEIKLLDHISNPYRWTHKRLVEYIKDFDENHEIGARLVSFGQIFTFHIEDIGYCGPDIISFYEVNENLESV
jgi:hypothetical protein